MGAIMESSFEVGEDYLTRGGWKAKVIWVFKASTGMLVVHKPGEIEETAGILHDAASGRALATFSVNAPPSFDQHPADLIAKWGVTSDTNGRNEGQTCPR